MAAMTLLFIPFFMLGCGSPDFAGDIAHTSSLISSVVVFTHILLSITGVSTAYPDLPPHPGGGGTYSTLQSADYAELDAQCNSNCNCTADEFTPVCGANEVDYKGS